MLNGYDEWHCDNCKRHKDWSEMVFTTHGDWCDECAEEEE